MSADDRKGRTRPALVFVYNAAGGLFNAVADAAHKILSPATYQCSLCALTHTAFRMRPEWKRFLATLDPPPEFLHADELRGRHGLTDVELPAVFARRDGRLTLLIDAAAINACRTLEELQQLVVKASSGR